MTAYSTYEAKAKFSELLRRARSGERIVISYYGEEVAELRALAHGTDDETSGVQRLYASGRLQPPRSREAEFRPLVKRPGALRRFLDERE